MVYKKKTYKRKKVAKSKWANKVMAVVNRRAETKMWSRFPGTFSTLDNSTNQWLTWNLTSGIVPGTNAAQVIGDQLFIKHLAIRMLFQNTTALGTTPHNNSYQVRIVVFRGKYDYTLTSYPLAEVFENNAGALPNPPLLGAIDTAQVTPLMDKTYNIDGANVSGATNRRLIKDFIRINKTFKYRNDDTFGKTSNLYLGILYGSGQDVVSCVSPATYLSYTDV